MGFLPMTREEMRAQGIDQLDFVYVTGDAYIDHSSFGTAIIARVLEAFGYSVGIVAQPDWRDAESVAVLGEPRLGFLVSSGNMDSMVNHYTSNKRRRSTDAYSPGGRAGLRPDRAVTVYANLVRKRFRDAPIVIGGIEASLRRLAHYDFWSDSIRRSVLLDSNADLLVYGMGERAIREVAATPRRPTATASSCRPTPSCSRTASPTPAASPCSTATWTPSPPRRSSNATGSTSSSSRTPLRNR